MLEFGVKVEFGRDEFYQSRGDVDQQFVSQRVGCLTVKCSLGLLSSQRQRDFKLSER